MRQSSEKKTHSTSIRMSPTQYEEIEKNASANKMTLSQYMVHAAVHYEKTLDANTVAKLQEICNQVCAMAGCDSKEGVAFRREVQALWSQLF